MQIHTTARHCELDPEVHLTARTRIEKLGRYARDLHEAHLIVTADRNRYNAEITIRLKGRELVSREEADQAGLAVDRAADRLEKQLRKLKDLRVDRKRGRTVNGRALDAKSGATPAGATAGDFEDLEFFGAETEAEEE
jgi:ribosomal subunit interface protein